MREEVTVACCNVEAVAWLLAKIDEAVIVADPEGRVAGCSRGAERLLGRSCGELLGSQIADIYVEDERAAHLSRFRSVALGTSPSSFDGTVKAQSGDLRPVRVEMMLVRDEQGDPACLLSTLQPLNGRREARSVITEVQLRDLRALIDTASVGMWVLDANRRFAFANPAALMLLGDVQAELNGRHLRDVLGEAAHQRLLPAVDKVMAGEEAMAELDIALPDGNLRHLIVHLVPRPGFGAGPEGCMAAVIDATHSKLLQQNQLRREQLLRATLVREINHRVKNSLQGLIGMLRLQASRGLPAADIVDQGVSQLMAVAVAFGLASRHGEAQILLCDLVSDIANNVGLMSQRRIHVHLSPAAVREPIVLSECYGANISLVINELVFNAIKHSANFDGSRAVDVFVDRDEESAELRVINESGSLPAGFSLESDVGLGTGLILIKALVPPEIGTLSIEQGREGVCARLALHAQLLTAGLA